MIRNQPRHAEKTALNSLTGTAPDLHLVRYSLDGTSSEVPLESLLRAEASQGLLWVDLRNDRCLPTVAERLGLPEALLPLAFAEGSAPHVGVDGEFAWCRVAIALHAGDLNFEGLTLDIFAGPGVVITRHRREIAFIDALRTREQGHSRLGELGGLAFMGSLLHWVLESYFDAVMSFEAELDRTEADILEDRHDEDSVRLASMRKTAARLRRMLGCHRLVFSSLSRPDFMPDASKEVSKLFNALEQQFQNAMDAVENTRELVVGTLEVLTNRIALRTNKSLRLLTVAAGLFGFMSVVVGAMGMNFETRFFQTKDVGFFLTIGSMLCISAAVLWVGLRRKWF